MPSQQTESRNDSQNPSINWQEIDRAKNDLKETFGFIPNFVDGFYPGAIPGAWNEARRLRFSEDTSLDLKQKSLIALSVGAVIPCDFISYFEKKACAAQGISTQEQAEAIAMAAIVRHWSVVVNGGAVDKEEFKKETDQVIKNVTKMMEDMKGKIPDQEFFLVMPISANDAYKDMEKTLGLVPKFFQVFPKESIAAAWSEFKASQLNPHTALTGKQKELIGLAVASQIPCEYCTYFHRNAASKLYGCSEDELNEAVAMAALDRHWSAIFNSPLNDQSLFRKDADQMIEKTTRSQMH